MDSPSPDVSSHESENVGSGTTYSAVEPLVSYSFTDIALTVTAVPPEAISDTNHPSVTIDPSSENFLNNNDYSYENCVPSESSSTCDLHTVSSHLEAPCDVREQSSVLCHDTALSASASPTATQPLDHMSPSVDSEVPCCAPIVAVCGAKEESLKQGLEQRLGIVLSKLARENDEEPEVVDDQLQTELVSDHFVEDDVVNQSSAPVETDKGSCASTDMGADTRHVLMMDIVQEMNEVERYSYVTLVAYVMHQLFEYSTWNRYVIFCFSAIQV